MLFTTIRNLLSSAENIHFTIEAAENNQLILLVQPVLIKEPEGLSDEAKQARAALALPLRINADTDTLDSDFISLLQNYAKQRNSISADFTVLSELKEAGKKAKNAVQTKTLASPENIVSEDKKDEVPPPTSPLTETPDSLF